VPGFLFLGANKIYFELRIKQKRRQLRKQFGCYAWNEPILRIFTPSRVTKRTQHESAGFFVFKSKQNSF
jgi:hypothetical protein